MTAQPPPTAHTTRAATRTTRAPARATTGPEWRVLDEPAAVRFLPSGTPLVLRWHEGLWQVIGTPLAWSSTSSWWEPGPTALGGVDGQGSILTTRYWRFHAQTGPSSPILEFDISTGPHHHNWRLRRVTHTDDY